MKFPTVPTLTRKFPTVPTLTMKFPTLFLKMTAMTVVGVDIKVKIGAIDVVVT